MSWNVHVRPGLLRHRLDDQVLVYDAREDRVHLLDFTTGCVLELLDEGRNTEEEIFAGFAARTNLIPGPELLALVVEELRKADLLDEGDGIPALPDVTRREMLRKAALTGSAALLIPVIVTLTSTKGYAQNSCLPTGAPCTCTPCIPPCGHIICQNFLCCSPFQCSADQVTGIGECI